MRCPYGGHLLYGGCERRPISYQLGVLDLVIGAGDLFDLDSNRGFRDLSPVIPDGSSGAERTQYRGEGGGDARLSSQQVYNTVSLFRFFFFGINPVVRRSGLHSTTRAPRGR